MNSIYLVEKLWQQPGGRKAAWGYEPIGYCNSKEDIAPLLERTITGTGFPFARGQEIKEYKISVLMKVTV